MTPNAVMIFAAGFGTRMGALTKDRPKPLIDVDGETLLDRTLTLAAEAQITRRVVNTHYLGSMIAAHLEGTDVVVSHEDPDILDTGGGLKAALPRLAADPVFTANADAVFDGPNPFTCLAEAWDEGNEALLLVVPLSRAVGRQGSGDFRLLPEGRLRRGGDHVYTGVQILRTGRVAATPEAVFSLNRVWDAAGEEDLLRAVEYPGRWCDVGHPEGIAMAEAVLRGHDV